MKTLTKLAAASILALSAIAPALAAGEEDTLLERNTYAAHNVQHNVRAHRAAEAFAYVPAAVATYSTQDFGIESQR
jgi:hypothetical protein